MARGLLDNFRKPDFNVAAFVRDAGAHGDTSRLSQQLQDAAATLEEDLRREIAACHEELLLCASSINDLDGQLGEAHDIVGALKASVLRVRGDVLVPFQDIKWKVELLERMQAVNVLIRRVVRFLWDARKLRSQMDAPGKDFSKAAHTLHELELLLQETGLDKVDILRAEVLWIRDVSAKVRRQSEEDLRSGVRQGNHIGLSVALQVFFNLQCLWPQLKKLLAELLEEVRQAPLPAGAGFHQALEVNLQVLVGQTQRVHALDEIIQAKADPVTHKSFQSVLEASNVNSLTSHFWAEAVGVFKAKFAKVCQDRAFRAKAVSDCPKVLQNLVTAVEKLGRGKVMKAVEREMLFQSVADLRNEYLGEAIKRITEPVEIMLPDKLLSSFSASGERLTGEAAATDELPTMHDLRRYVQLLVTELERVESCPELLLKDIIRSVRSSVLFFATRLEQVVDSSNEIQCLRETEGRLQLISPLPMPAPGHARNARLFGIAHHTLTALKELLPQHFQQAVVTEQVTSTLKQTQAAVVTPIFGSLHQSLIKASMGTSDDLTAVCQAAGHLNRYYFSLFGAGQLQGHVKEFCVFAVIMAQAKGESMGNQAPIWKYLIVSLSNVYASSCQYEALKYVSFAVQMLGKSFKMMPVMIWGIIISGKSYSLRDWMVALTVTVGCTEFLMTGPTHSKVDATNSMKGFLLLGGFLALDGLTSTFQEKLFKEHQTTKYNQMLYINLLSAAVSFVTLLATGNFLPAITFSMEHPKFLADCALLSGSAVASQWCIYSQIKEFGALVFAATMNVRQVVSILVSYVKYHNPVTALQILGLLLIFAALFFKSIAAMLEGSKSEKKPLIKGIIEDKVEGVPATDAVDKKV